MGGNKGWEKIKLNTTANSKNFSKVLVLQGGVSEEKEVSDSTAESCIEALKRLNLDVYAVSINSNNIHDLAEVIKSQDPDIIFNALHGGIGENGTIQGLFETLKIPYTHSGVISSAIAMDKILSKKIFIKNKILTPKFIEYSFRENKKQIINKIEKNLRYTFNSKSQHLKKRKQ